MQFSSDLPLLTPSWILPSLSRCVSGTLTSSLGLCSHLGLHFSPSSALCSHDAQWGAFRLIYLIFRITSSNSNAQPHFLFPITTCEQGNIISQPLRFVLLRLHLCLRHLPLFGLFTETWSSKAGEYILNNLYFNYFLNCPLLCTRMYFSWWWCRQAWSEDPEGILLDQPRVSLASHRMEIISEPVGSESRVYWRNRERDTKGASGRLGKEKEHASRLWGLGFWLTIVIWCTCHLRSPGTRRIKDKVQMFNTLDLFPGSRSSCRPDVQC